MIILYIVFVQIAVYVVMIGNPKKHDVVLIMIWAGGMFEKNHKEELPRGRAIVQCLV